MISAGSYDWSNDAEISALHHWNKLHFKIYSDFKHFFKYNNILLYFDQINAALVNISISKTSKTKLLNGSVHLHIIIGPATDGAVEVFYRSV